MAKDLEKELARVYSEARKELEEKLKDFEAKYRAKDLMMQKKRSEGKITDAEYKDWQQGQVFIGKQWQNKVKQMTETLNNTSNIALDMVRGYQYSTYADAANHQLYELEKHLKTGTSFELYDTDAVSRLVQLEPELMPRKVINGQKQAAWNKKKISNIVTQGIIQGKSIDDIAKDMSRKTAVDNMKHMVRYARTAMTAAENAGTMDTMHRAEEMGIKVRKRWLATLDSRTRDSHRDLDGQEQDIDKPFVSELGKIMYPGDPNANQGDVWNCRCTMEYVYPEYDKSKWTGERRDQENDRNIADMTYSQWLVKKERETDGIVKRQRIDVTDEYIKNARPRVGKVTWDKDYKFDKDHEREVKIGKYLNRKFGGNVHLVQEIYESEGKKYYDFIWRGKYWELKSPEAVTGTNSALLRAGKQIEKTPGGIILDYNLDNFDLDEVLRVADNKLQTLSYNLDLMILNKNRLVCIKRYKK